MIKILHFVSSLSVTNGITNFIMNYYRNISKDNIQFDFIYFVEEQVVFSEEIHALGGKVFLLPRPTSINGIKAYHDFFKRNAGNYKAIHNHEVYLNFFIAALAKKYKIPNVIIHAHAVKYSEKWLNNIRNGLLCKFVKLNTNYFFACSIKSACHLYGKRFMNEGKVTIIKNAIDYSKYAFDGKKRERLRKNLNIGEDTLVIGHVGRFSYAKNHAKIIEIFNEICKLYKDTLLILIGDGPLIKQIKSKIIELKIEDRVKFLGETDQAHMLYNIFDIFLFPSLHEGLGIAAIEAQVAGIPCFVSEAISQEVFISDWIFQLNNKNDSSYWAKYIIDKYSKVNKNNILSETMSKEYDINCNTEKLESFYIDL